MRLLYWLFGLSVKSVQIRPSYNSHLNYFVFVFIKCMLLKSEIEKGAHFIYTHELQHFYNIFCNFQHAHYLFMATFLFVFKLPPVVRPSGQQHVYCGLARVQLRLSLGQQDQRIVMDKVVRDGFNHWTVWLHHFCISVYWSEA